MAKRSAGPGPGAYRLPTLVGFGGHDPQKYRNPMYSFGTMGTYTYRSLGPGPAYKVDRITREGNMASPAWTLGARFATRAATRTPGPGAHAPERCPLMKELRAPMYSMGPRLGFNLKRLGPGPAAYMVKMGSGAPAWSMSARLGLIGGKAKSPGPAAYFQKDQNIYKLRFPVYSLGARLEGVGKATRTPGPAAYPPNLYNIKKAPPNYSFGTKHSDWAPPMIVAEDTMDCL